MYSLNQLFEQALEDPYAAVLDGYNYDARIVYGIKIVRDIETEEVQVINTMVGGDFGKVLNSEQLSIFVEKGWRYGVYIVSLDNYRTKLDRIERLIRDEVNGRNSLKAVTNYKSQRDRILSKYTEIKNKLNQLN